MQGFAWMGNAVLFEVLDNAFVVQMTVQGGDAEDPPAPETVRATEVPFSVPEGAKVMISTQVTDKFIPVPPGRYMMRVEQAPLGNDQVWCRIRLIKGERKPSILRADSTMAPPAELCMEAEDLGG